MVAGVLSRIKAYEVAVSESYQLLLSRRWLKRVRAVEYHHSRLLYIEGSDKIRRKVSGIPVVKTPVQLEKHWEDGGGLEIGDEEADEAVDTLLRELRLWEEIEEDPQQAEN